METLQGNDGAAFVVRRLRERLEDDKPNAKSSTEAKPKPGSTT